MARSRSTSFDAPMRRICCPMQSYTLPFWDLRKGAPPASSYISGIQSVASRSNAINLGRDTDCIDSGVRLMARDLTEERHAMQLWMDLHSGVRQSCVTECERRKHICDSDDWMMTSRQCLLRLEVPHGVCHILAATRLTDAARVSYCVICFPATVQYTTLPLFCPIP